jgi:ferric-dicitrate binding protein FerR (iron transport regulator)
MAEVGHRIGEVVRYRDREMSPAESREFEAHLAGCADCQAALRAAEAALSTFDELVGHGRAPLDTEEALRRVRKGEAAAQADRRRRRVWVGALALAAAVLAVIAFTLARVPQPEPRQEIAKVPPKPAREPRVQSAPIAEPPDAGA